LAMIGKFTTCQRFARVRAMAWRGCSPVAFHS
jgi:hypothetical protein